MAKSLLCGHVGSSVQVYLAVECQCHCSKHTNPLSCQVMLSVGLNSSNTGSISILDSFLGITGSGSENRVHKSIV